MATIKHVFTNPQADVGDPTIVQPSDWNSIHAFTLVDGISLSGNTAGVLANISSGTFYLAGGNNITVSQNANSVTISGANTVAQSEQTQSRFNLTIGGNTAGAGALISSGVMTLAGGNNITVSQAGNAITISAANETQTVPPIATTVKSVLTANSVGTVTRFAAEDHGHEGVFAGGVSNVGNTAGNTTVQPGRIVLAGGNNITLSVGTAAGALQTITISAANETVTSPPIATTVNSVATANSVGTVTRFAPEDHRHQGVYAVGVSNVGNTSGNTTVQAGQIVLAGGNNITLSVGTAANALQTITISAGAGGGGPSIATSVESVASANSTGTVTRYAPEDHRHEGIYKISVAGNTAGNTTSGGGSLALAGGPNITLSGSTAAGGMTISVSGGAGGSPTTVSRFIFPTDDFAALSTVAQGSFLVQRIQVPVNVTATKMAFFMSLSIVSAANNSSAYFDQTQWLGIYTRSVATLNSVSSTTNSFTVSWSSNSSGSVIGMREMVVPININMAPGEYYVGLGLSTTNTATAGAATTALGASYTLMGAVGLNSSFMHAVPFGVATATSRNWMSGIGLLSATTNAVPATISLSDINQTGTNVARANLVVDFRNVD